MSGHTGIGVKLRINDDVDARAWVIMADWVGRRLIVTKAFAPTPWNFGGASMEQAPLTGSRRRPMALDNASSVAGLNLGSVDSFRVFVWQPA